MKELDPASLSWSELLILAIRASTSMKGEENASDESVVDAAKSEVFRRLMAMAKRSQIQNPEDVAADIWLKLFQDDDVIIIKTIIEHSHPERYLQRAVKNSARDTSRRLSRWQLFDSQGSPEIEEFVDYSPGLDAEAKESLVLYEVLFDEAFDHLDQLDRDILKAKFRGEKNEAIANRLGQSYTWVTTRAGRATKTLRRRLADLGQIQDLCDEEFELIIAKIIAKST